MDWQAIVLSVRLALCTSAILLLVGLPIAYFLATTRWRGRVLLEAVVALPLVLPPTVLGVYVLTMAGPRGWLGQGYHAATGRTLPFTFEGLVLASVLYSLPFAVQPFTAGFRAVDRRLVEAAWTLGGSRWTTFRRITIPLAWPGLLAGIVLSFTHTLGEFGVVLMVGGNIPGETRTISIAIYDQVQSLEYGAAMRTSVFLLAVSFVVLTITYAMHAGYRVWPLQPPRRDRPRE